MSSPCLSSTLSIDDLSRSRYARLKYGRALVFLTGVLPIPSVVVGLLVQRSIVAGLMCFLLLFASCFALCAVCLLVEWWFGFPWLVSNFPRTVELSDGVLEIRTPQRHFRIPLSQFTWQHGRVSDTLDIFVMRDQKAIVLRSLQILGSACLSVGHSADEYESWCSFLVSANIREQTPRISRQQAVRGCLIGLLMLVLLVLVSAFPGWVSSTIFLVAFTALYLFRVQLRDWIYDENESARNEFASDDGPVSHEQ